jgi:hypothetical protein
MLRTVVFLGLLTSAFASATLDVLVNAAASFSATIQQQLEMLQSNPSPAELAEKTVDYAEAKEAYFKALRAEVPELLKVATGRQARPPELDTFAAAFARARAEFEHAQRAEQTFHKDFDGLDLTMSVTRIRTIAPPIVLPFVTIQK